MAPLPGPGVAAEIDAPQAAVAVHVQSVAVGGPVRCLDEQVGSLQQQLGLIQIGAADPDLGPLPRLQRPVLHAGRGLAGGRPWFAASPLPVVGLEGGLRPEGIDGEIVVLLAGEPGHGECADDRAPDGDRHRPRVWGVLRR